LSHCMPPSRRLSLYFFSFNYPAPTEIYTLSLHDALPISTARIELPDGRVLALRLRVPGLHNVRNAAAALAVVHELGADLVHHREDRKSTRLNSSHVSISYAVFCLKKKKKKTDSNPQDITI